MTSKRPEATATSRETLLGVLRANRRPVAFALASLGCLLVHHVVVRIMAHDRVAHDLLSSAQITPSPHAAALVVTLAIGRFVSVMLVPGLLLAAAAELLAYLVVGPVREEEEVDDVLDDSADGER